MPRRLSTSRASISGVALVLALLTSLLPAVLVGPSAHAAGGTLSGTLTWPDSIFDGDPVDYFQVDIYQADGPDAWAHAIAPLTITVDHTGLPMGEFAIPLPAGTYRACFEKLGFGDDVGRRCWSDGYDVFGGTDFVVTEGGTTTITPQLPHDAQVKGRIVGAEGVGISAYVAPYRRAPDGTWTSVFGEQSIADGSFVVPHLDPGTYRFCLLDVPREYLPECWDDVATLAEAAELALAPGSNGPLKFRLVRRANISGTVTRPPGSTASIGLTAHRFRLGRWEPVAFAPTGPDGGFRITGLDADTYRVCAYGYDILQTCWRTGSQVEDATDIVLATGQYRRHVDLAPGQAGFVSGTLPDVYLGAEGYPSVTAWRQVGDTWQSVASGDSTPTGIGNDWTYEVGSLPTGTYVVCVEHIDPEFVTAFPRTCNGGSPSPQGGIPFEVVAGATTSGIDIATGQAGEIRGGVLGSSTRVRVDLYAPTGRLALSRWTGADDRYRFTELPPGEYRVGFHRAPARSSLAAEWWHNRGDGGGLAGATPVTVDGSSVTGIRATLDAGGTIDGRLLDSAGNPVMGCVVQARARDLSLAVRSAVSDATGDFSIGGLSTASYVVLVPKACSGASTGIYYDTDSPNGTTARLRDADDVAAIRGGTTTLADDLHTSG